jgi:hypothetical protein
MAHYAFLDKNNIVTRVIAGVDENIVQTDSNGIEIGGSSEAWEIWYGNLNGEICKRTSYNNRIRKNYAGIGFTYDPERDAFIAPEPLGHIGFDEETCRWIMPVIDELS